MIWPIFTSPNADAWPRLGGRNVPPKNFPVLEAGSTKTAAEWGQKTLRGGCGRIGGVSWDCRRAWEGDAPRGRPNSTVARGTGWPEGRRSGVRKACSGPEARLDGITGGSTSLGWSVAPGLLRPDLGGFPLGKAGGVPWEGVPFPGKPGGGRRGRKFWWRGVLPPWWGRNATGHHRVR